MEKFQVIVFNVGAGDNLLIRLPSGEFGLIDFYYQANLNQHKPPSIAYLEALSETENIVIAFCCITHYDFDHIKGVEYLWDFSRRKNIPIKNLWFSGSDSKIKLLKVFQKIVDTRAFQNKLQFEKERVHKLLSNIRKNLEELSSFSNLWQKKMDRRIKHIKNVATIDNSLSPNIKSFSIGPLDHHIEKYELRNFEEIILHLLPSELKLGSVDNNLISCIIFFQSDNFSCVFGGDAPLEVWHDGIDENESKNLGFNLSSDFIKVSHHGSKNSSSLKIWNELIKGKKEVHFGISAGDKHNHPNLETLSQIKDCCQGIKFNIWSTNICEMCSISAGEDYDLFNGRNGYEGMLFNSDRSPRYKYQAESQHGFLGFKFEFEPGTDKVDVFRLRDKKIPLKENCLPEENASDVKALCKFGLSK
ncbi:MAG: hypothetical protein QM791_09690 [Ferruginibacter sp.]